MKSCPNQEALFGYLVGAIPEQTAEQIAQHVDACQECERTVQALEGLSDTVITALRHQVRSDTFAEEPALQQAVSRLRQVTARKVESDTRASVESPQTETTPARTKKLGDYELLKKLGQGGMGTVYKARHTKLKRIVALKVLPKNRLASAEAVARFEREMEAVGRLDHPNIVRAMDAREVAGIRFLVMEHVDGLDLAEICNRGGSLNIPDACEVVRQAALGLQCSQENGLVHRDVKPSNLMLTTSGEVKILDLGLAHIQEAESSEGEVTGVGQIMGTPDYMSPEQALESHNVDIRTDVYSLGCTFYRLLADRAPFSGLKYDTAMKKVAAHLHDEADPIQLLRPDLPKPIAMLIERMLSKDPHDRPSTPSAVVDALAPFCQGSKLIGLLRDASRKKRLAAETEASDVETGDLRGSDDVETSRDGPPVQEAAVKPSGAGDLDPYHRWLGIPKAEQPANRYRLLGIAKFEDDPEVIRDAAARQMAHVRTYQLGPHAEMSQKILNELGAAKACLLNEKKRAAYDAQLRAERAPPVTDAPKQRRPKPAAPKRRPATPKPRSATPPPHPATPKMPVAHVEPRRTATVARPFAERWNPPTWVWVAASAAGFFVLLSIVLFIMTGKGRIKITLSDPRARVEIKVDGDTIDIIGLEEPLRLRAGQHELVVSGSGFKTISRKFTVRRGNNPVLEIELIPLATGPRAKSPPAQVTGNGDSQDDNSSPPPQTQRWLGYDPGTGARKRLSEIAGHTNYALGPMPSRLQAQDIQSARALGVKLLLPVDTRESMAELLASKIELVKADRETIIGILAICPPYFKIGADDLTDFARKLKRAVPNTEFWVALADAGKAPPTYVLPAEVDCLMVDVVSCTTREQVERRAREVWPTWVTAAAGRKVVLCWDSWEKGTAGMVPYCQPGAIQALGEAVERLNLQGLLFSTYGDNAYHGTAVTGIESRPYLVSEVKAIAARWGVGSQSTSTSGDTQGQRDPLSPTQAVRIAIVTGEDITAHNWRESSQALKEVLQENRQLTADVIEDPGFLASEKLFDYQVVVLNFNNENPLPQELQARNNLAGFVEQGRGLILIHAASRAFFGWDKFGEIAGRTMARPPTHDPIREITVHVVDRSHPITQGLANFQVRDELYTCLEGDWPIQVLATARSVVTGADYPMAFVSNYGDGRVFHLSLGHSADAIRSADVATMIRRGAAWVAVPSLGDQQPSASDATTAPATQRTVRLSNWEDLKYGMFIHFGMSTFTERNADRGDSPSTTYAPSQLDVPQWIEVAKKSGMKYAVLTAKHHSGHCLWNGTSTDYDVSTSANTTDVVAEFMRACHLEGIKPGIYYSIADGHNEPGAELQWRTPVSQSYFQLIKQQITELHTRHSDIYEQWLDLAGKLNGAQRQELYTLIKKLNPNCLVAMSGQGKGSITGYLSLWPTDILSMYGMPHRSVQHDPNRFWLGETCHLPLEVHATIVKRWWYQPSDPVKTTKEFRALWRSTAGKGANLLLNVPPDRTGRIPQAYINVLREYKKIIDQESG